MSADVQPTLDFTKKVPLVDPDSGKRLTRVRVEFRWGSIATDTKQQEQPKKGFFSRVAASMGLAQTPDPEPTGVDLDATLIGLSNGQPIGAAWHSDLTPFVLDNAVTHEGDADGSGNGGTEAIVIDMTLLPQEVDTLIGALGSYHGDTFDRVNGVVIKITDLETSKQFARILVPIVAQYNAAIAVEITQDGNGGWNLRTTKRAFGMTPRGGHWRQLIPIYDEWLQTNPA